jgi:hypothetical protein
LSAAPEIPANVRLTGLRGVGKTVLLAKFTEVAEDLGWSTVSLELEQRHNTDAGFVQALLAQLHEMERRLSRVAQLKATVQRGAELARNLLRVEYQGLEFSVSGDLAGDARQLGDAIARVCELAVKVGREGVVLLLDEAQILTDDKGRSGNHPLSLLLATVSALQKQEFPVALVLCGLPTLTVNLLNARTYSERMFRGEEVSSLPGSEARDAFLEPIRSTSMTADEALVAEVLADVDGYPYFIQLWGAELWQAAVDVDAHSFTTDLLEATRPEIYRRLDLDFYEPRVASLTPAEQDLLTDASRCTYPPLVVSEMNRASKKSDANVNVLLGRLVQANVLFRPRKGAYLYTAPGFREYLIRRSERQADHP